MRRIFAITMVAALTAAAPAYAQHWHGGGGGWHGGGGGWHHGGSGFGPGAAIAGGLLGLGIAGAIAGSQYNDGYDDGYTPYYAAPRYSARCPYGYYFASDGLCYPG